MSTIESLTSTLNIGERLAAAWRLFKVSAGVVRREPSLIVVTLLALFVQLLLPVAIAALLLALLVPAGIGGIVSGSLDPDQAFGALVAVMAGFLAFSALFSGIIGAYFGGAIAEIAMERIEGRDPSVGSGLAAASRRFKALAVFGFISGIVRLLTSSSGGSGRQNIATQAMNVARTAAAELYRLLTSLALPVIMREPVGGTEAIGRSTAIVRSVWPQAIASGFGIRALTGLASFLPVLVVGVTAFVTISGLPSVELADGTTEITGDVGAALLPLLPLIVAAIVVSTLITQVGNLLEAVYNAALYLYATTGKAGDFDAADLAKAAVTSDGVVKPGAAA